MSLSNDALLELGKLRHDHTLADFTIASSSGEEWRVHKLILRLHSDVLYRMSTSAEFIECQRGRVVIQEVDDRCIEAMVDFFYAGESKLSVESEEKGRVDKYTDEGLREYLGLRRDLFQLAHMYNVKAIQDDVVHSTAFWLGQAADPHFAVRLASTMIDVEDLPEGMWEGLIDYCARHMRGEETEPYDVEGMLEVFERRPQLAVAVLRRIAEKNEADKEDDV
ncbi:hypothetical protein M409DRAFT_25465 [Zasmidium cellare ATCC 36951]|uniref:BTB domain-containing protein n=1 Tax=Zasmidium cellare ATCC 36951 TaxID=1080233 RepID=A0A6A6CEN3_ZASCE|nr:uncharacterized protein M409DRAFT_25465 [Zasmidium cellare ATCC 36951]KAF2164119.1 hypothetical protein M409DRAFT_25465 [Zasmidium cellare ATCC 36951]